MTCFCHGTKDTWNSLRGYRFNTYRIELLQAEYSDKNKMEASSTELIDTWK